MYPTQCGYLKIAQIHTHTETHIICQTLLQADLRPLTRCANAMKYLWAITVICALSLALYIPPHNPPLLWLFFLIRCHMQSRRHNGEQHVSVFLGNNRSPNSPWTSCKTAVKLPFPWKHGLKIEKAALGVHNLGMWASVLTLQWCLDRQCQVNVWLEGANIAPLWVAVTMASIWSTNGSIPAHLPDPGSRDNKPCRQTAHMLWLMRADTLSKHATENSPSVFTHSHTLKIESELQRWDWYLHLCSSQRDYFL